MPAVSRGQKAPDLADFPAGDVPNSRGLVSARWLRRQLEPVKPIDRGADPTIEPGELSVPLIVVEASWAAHGEPHPYREGHIPGAALLDTDTLEDGYPRWRLRPIDELRDAIGAVGIRARSTVIVYARRAIMAARAWWVLKYCGVTDVRILNGGWDAWVAAGGAANAAEAAPAAVEFNAPIAEDMRATTDYVRARVADGRAWLVDVRSEAEFAGRTSGYDYLDARGRIPGAIHADDADDRARVYVLPDGKLRATKDVLEHWSLCGIVRRSEAGPFQREVIFYCGSGWRSSLAFFQAWLLGIDNIRNYSDGWSGWSTQYHEEAGVGGSTPGWRQLPTGNPIEREARPAADNSRAD